MFKIEPDGKSKLREIEAQPNMLINLKMNPRVKKELNINPS